MALRDTHGISSVLQKAGNMGRGGDDRMAHVGTGETMIPPEVIDNYPQILPHIVKAFQSAGQDWRTYVAGTPRNRVNPRTGAPEFAYGGDNYGGGNMDDGRGAPGEPGSGGGEYGPGGYGSVGGREPGSYTGGGPNGNVGGGGGNDGGFTFGGGYLTDDMPASVTYNPETGQIAGEKTYDGSTLAGSPGFMVDEMPSTVSFNPETGQIAREGTPPGQDPGFNPSEMMQTPGGPLGYGLKQAAKHMFSGPGYTPAGGMAATIGGRAANRDSGGGGIGDGTPGSGLERNLYNAPSVPVTMPSYLEFAPGMTDLQRRAQIATFALNADDSRYGTQETEDYYKSLIQGVDYNDLLPIEKQYLTQVLGLPPGQAISSQAAPSLSERVVNDLRFSNGGGYGNLGG